MHVKSAQSGVTLVEALVASAVFVGIAVTLYAVFTTMTTFVRIIRTKTILAEIASQRMEFIRNLEYNNVGTINGIPSGVIPQTESIVQNGQTFSVLTSIRNIDNPEDGTLGGVPNDLSPADNKRIQIDVSCASCNTPQAVSYTSIVAPKNLETENGNGVLVIKVVDANGQPVPQSQVHIVNTSLTPSVSITDTTDGQGNLSLVDAPPSTQAYQIEVTKNGYSSERTYMYGAAENPTPTKPHVTVSANTITQDTFAIDKTSSISLGVMSTSCTPLSGITTTLTGAKIIGTPSVIKTIISSTSNSSGTTQLSNVEWDTYALGISSSAYRLVGNSVVSPFFIAPSIEQSIALLFAPTEEKTFAMGVFDTNMISQENATVMLEKNSDTYQFSTGKGYVVYPLWNEQKLSSFSSGVDFSTEENVRLHQTNGLYDEEGEIISNTIDLGLGGVPEELLWNGVLDTNTSIRFQVAVNNDMQTWNFVGPDGTPATYFETTTIPLSSFSTGRYLRYKAILHTDDTGRTPYLTRVTVSYSNACLLKSFVYVVGLQDGGYAATISKINFTPTHKSITIPSINYETITLSQS